MLLHPAGNCRMQQHLYCLLLSGDQRRRAKSAVLPSGWMEMGSRGPLADFVFLFLYDGVFRWIRPFLPSMTSRSRECS